MAKKTKRTPAPKKAPASKPVPAKVFNAPEVPKSWTGAIVPDSKASPPKAPGNVWVQTRARGSSGIRLYAGYFAEEYLLNELSSTTAADNYDKMRRSDAKIKMALNAVKTPIMAANWEIQPATADDPDHKVHADFIDHVLFKGMDKPFSKREVLSIADFGHAVFEITHKAVLNHPTFGSYTGLKSLGWRSPRSILEWHVDASTGQIKHIRQLVTGDEGRDVELSGEFLLVNSLEKEGDNFEGVSLLRAAYGGWKRKNLYLKLLAIGIERNAIPTPTAEIPDGKQNSVEYNTLVSAMENYTSHENSYFTFPEGWKIDFLENDFDPEKLKAAIDLENQEIVGAFMANFLMLGQSQSGSRAVSMDQSQFFLGAIQAVADESIMDFNHKLIPELIKMKFGPQDAYPQFKITGISDKAGKELADALSNLAHSQYIQPDDETEEHLRRRFGIPKKSEKGVRVVQAAARGKGPAEESRAGQPRPPEPEEENEPIQASEFAIPEERRYPIGTVASAADALRRCIGKPGEAIATRNILKKYPGLKPAAEALKKKSFA